MSESKCISRVEHAAAAIATEGVAEEAVEAKARVLLVEVVQQKKLVWAKV